MSSVVVIVVPLCGIMTVVNLSGGMSNPKTKEFIESIPVSSNYIIERSFWGDKICEFDLKHRRTYLKIKEHLKLSNIGEDCELGLNEVQVDQLKALDTGNVITFPED